RGKTRRPRPKVEADIDAIRAPRWVARVVRTELSGQTPATMRLTWRIDEQARHALEEEIFGKRILVTDHDDWPITAVIDAYQTQDQKRLDLRKQQPSLKIFGNSG